MIRSGDNSAPGNGVEPVSSTASRPRSRSTAVPAQGATTRSSRNRAKTTHASGSLISSAVAPLTRRVERSASPRVRAAGAHPRVTIDAPLHLQHTAHGDAEHWRSLFLQSERRVAVVERDLSAALEAAATVAGNASGHAMRDVRAVTLIAQRESNRALRAQQAASAATKRAEVEHERARAVLAAGRAMRQRFTNRVKGLEKELRKLRRMAAAHAATASTSTPAKKTSTGAGESSSGGAVGGAAVASPIGLHGSAASAPATAIVSPTSAGAQEPDDEESWERLTDVAEAYDVAAAVAAELSLEGVGEGDDTDVCEPAQWADEVGPDGWPVGVSTAAPLRSLSRGVDGSLAPSEEGGDRYAAALAAATAALTAARECGRGWSGPSPPYRPKGRDGNPLWADAIARSTVGDPPDLSPTASPKGTRAPSRAERSLEDTPRDGDADGEPLKDDLLDVAALTAAMQRLPKEGKGEDGGATVSAVGVGEGGGEGARVHLHEGSVYADSDVAVGKGEGAGQRRTARAATEWGGRPPPAIFRPLAYSNAERLFGSSAPALSVVGPSQCGVCASRQWWGDAPVNAEQWEGLIDGVKQWAEMADDALRCARPTHKPIYDEFSEGFLSSSSRIPMTSVTAALPDGVFAPRGPVEGGETASDEDLEGEEMSSCKGEAEGYTYTALVDIVSGRPQPPAARRRERARRSAANEAAVRVMQVSWAHPPHRSQGLLRVVAQLLLSAHAAVGASVMSELLAVHSSALEWVNGTRDFAMSAFTEAVAAVGAAERRAKEDVKAAEAAAEASRRAMEAECDTKVRAVEADAAALRSAVEAAALERIRVVEEDAQSRVDDTLRACMQQVAEFEGAHEMTKAQLRRAREVAEGVIRELENEKGKGSREVMAAMEAFVRGVEDERAAADAKVASAAAAMADRMKRNEREAQDQAARLAATYEERAAQYARAAADADARASVKSRDLLHAALLCASNEPRPPPLRSPEDQRIEIDSALRQQAVEMHRQLAAEKDNTIRAKEEVDFVAREYAATLKAAEDSVVAAQDAAIAAAAQRDDLIGSAVQWRDSVTAQMARVLDVRLQQERAVAADAERAAAMRQSALVRALHTSEAAVHRAEGETAAAIRGQAIVRQHCDAANADSIMCIAQQHVSELNREEEKNARQLEASHNSLRAMAQQVAHQHRARAEAEDQVRAAVAGQGLAVERAEMDAAERFRATARAYEARLASKDSALDDATRLQEQTAAAVARLAAEEHARTLAAERNTQSALRGQAVVADHVTRQAHREMVDLARGYEEHLDREASRTAAVQQQCDAIARESARRSAWDGATRERLDRQPQDAVVGREGVRGGLNRDPAAEDFAAMAAAYEERLAKRDCAMRGLLHPQDRTVEDRPKASAEERARTLAAEQGYVHVVRGGGAAASPPPPSPTGGACVADSARTVPGAYDRLVPRGAPSGRGVVSPPPDAHRRRFAGSA